MVDCHEAANRKKHIEAEWVDSGFVLSFGLPGGTGADRKEGIWVAGEAPGKRKIGRKDTQYEQYVDKNSIKVFDMKNKPGTSDFIKELY